MGRNVLKAMVVLATLGTVAVGGVADAGPPDGFRLPDRAVEVHPGVFYLGSRHVDGQQVSGYAYAHHKDGHDKGGSEEPPPPPGGDESSCYSFIANGAHWKTVEPVVVDPDATPDLGVSIDDIEGWMRAWSDQSAVSPILGPFSPGGGLEADTVRPDGSNEVYFDAIADPGVLGYAIVWSVSRGRPSDRGIVEADVVVEDGEWDWWAGDGPIGSSQLDLGAVFVHEAGHYMGLGHTPETETCVSQTMYPSVVAGDDSKRSLGLGDITGIETLYN